RLIRARGFHLKEYRARCRADERHAVSLCDEMPRHVFRWPHREHKTWVRSQERLVVNDTQWHVASPERGHKERGVVGTPVPQLQVWSQRIDEPVPPPRVAVVRELHEHVRIWNDNRFGTIRQPSKCLKDAF